MKEHLKATLIMFTINLGCVFSAYTVAKIIATLVLISIKS